MLLYHYSKVKFDEIKTLSAQGRVSQKEKADYIAAAKFRKEPAPYCDHVSLFLDPLDLNAMGYLYQSVDHAAWKNGNVLYEYVIDIERCVDSFLFNIVETPEQVIYTDENWVEPMCDGKKISYYEGLFALKKQHRYVGSGLAGFKEAAHQFVGRTMSTYQSKIGEMTTDELLTYAARVPHAMLYPSTGVFELAKEPREHTITIPNHLPSVKW